MIVHITPEVWTSETINLRFPDKKPEVGLTDSEPRQSSSLPNLFHRTYLFENSFLTPRSNRDFSAPRLTSETWDFWGALRVGPEEVSLSELATGAAGLGFPDATGDVRSCPPALSALHLASATFLYSWGTPRAGGASLGELGPGFLGPGIPD